MRQTYRFHPWRRLRDLGPSWKLKWSAHLPEDLYGFTDFARRTITLREGMSFEERRCTITHELEHVARGPASHCGVLGEEIEVDRRVARLLLPSMQELVDSLIWHRGDYEQTAEDLWVDVWTLEVRLSTLLPLEQGYLNRRLDDFVLVSVDD